MTNTENPSDAQTEDEPTERHRDVALDTVDETDDLNLSPDFDAEETDDADEVFEDDDDETEEPA